MVSCALQIAGTSFARLDLPLHRSMHAQQRAKTYDVYHVNCILTICICTPYLLGRVGSVFGLCKRLKLSYVSFGVDHCSNPQLICITTTTTQTSFPHLLSQMLVLMIRSGCCQLPCPAPMAASCSGNTLACRRMWSLVVTPGCVELCMQTAGES